MFFVVVVVVVCSKGQPCILEKMVSQIPTIQEQELVHYWGELCRQATVLTFDFDLYAKLGLIRTHHNHYN